MKRWLSWTLPCVLGAIFQIGALGQTARGVAGPPLTRGPTQWVVQEARLRGDGLRDLQRDRVSKLTEFPQQIVVHAQQQLGLKPEEAEKSVSWQIQSGQNAMDPFTLRIRIDPKQGVDAAKAKTFIADELTALRKLASDLLQEQRAQEIAAGEKRVKETEEALAKVREQRRVVRQALQQKTGQIDVLPSALNAAANKAQTEFQQLDLDRRAKEARHQALEKAIAELAKEVEEKAKNDPVAAELEKVVQMREKRIEHMKELAGQKAVSTTEVDEKIGEAAEARAKLLERRREAAAEAGGNLMAQLNKDLLMLSIDSAEENSRYQILEARCEALRSSLDDAEQLESLQKQVAKVEKQSMVAAEELSRSRRKLADDRVDLQTAEPRTYSEPVDAEH